MQSLFQSCGILNELLRTFTIYKQVSFFFHSALFHKRGEFLPRPSGKLRNVILHIYNFGSRVCFPVVVFFPHRIYCSCITITFCDSLAFLQSWVECRRPAQKVRHRFTGTWFESLTSWVIIFFILFISDPSWKCYMNTGGS